MNKNLYIKREKCLKDLEELEILLDTVYKFLKDNGKKFRKEQSIAALKKIEEYYEKKERDYKKCEGLERQIFLELYSTCKHEVALKSDTPCYKCLICDRDVVFNSVVIPVNSLIFIDATNDYQAASIIKDFFKEIVYSDKDLIEAINELIEEMQYDKKIKVYRR